MGFEAMEPLDYSDRYNTVLSRQDEADFQAWAAAAGRKNDTADYDLRGAWKADAKQAANGHLPDTWKKPNHPTFSAESMYNGLDGAQGGQWVEGKGGEWEFHASPYNLSNLGLDGITKYFREREPKSRLILPSTMDMAHDFSRIFNNAQRPR